MTQKVDRIPEHEKTALCNRLTTALFDAGFSHLISSNFVRVTNDEVSFAPMSFGSALLFTNQLNDLARTMSTPEEPTTDRASLNQLAIAFEECHTVPTGYSPTKFVQEAST